MSTSGEPMHSPPRASVGSTADPAAIADELSEREREVLTLVARGLRNKAIADELCIAAETVKSHLRSIYRKLGVNTRGEATWMMLNGEIRELAPAEPERPAPPVSTPSPPPPAWRDAVPTHTWAATSSSTAWSGRGAHPGHPTPNAEPEPSIRRQSSDAHTTDQAVVWVGRNLA